MSAIDLNLSWDIGALESGQSISLVITVTADSSGTPVCEGNVTSPDTDLGCFANHTSLEISATNLPTANDDTATTDEDLAVNINVLANDTDPDNDSLEIISVTQGGHGLVSILPSKLVVSYTPETNWFGIDFFNYSISDKKGGTDTAMVQVSVSSVNDIPVIMTMDLKSVLTGQYYENDYDAVDVDTADILTWSLVSGPAWLSLDPVSGLLSGTPSISDAGASATSVRVNDGNGGVAYSNFTLDVILDTDGDGIPDSTDNDDDGDGVPDDEDAFPVDPMEDSDSDGDGVGDNADTDDDNDGVPDSEDDFPNDPTEDTDSDGDGVGDNADPDDDNDGVPDTEDDFPNDPTEDTDSDGDGIGDNADPDDDNDGVPDAEDAFPLDPTESADADGDGIGDNADPDDDNDGVLDVDEGTPESSVDKGFNLGDYWWFFAVVIIMMVVGVFFYLRSKNGKEEV